MHQIVKVLERFYTRLYASKVMPGDTTEPTSFACEVPLVSKEEIEKEFKSIETGSPASKEGITVDLLNEGGDVLEKLAQIFSECLITPNMPIGWTNDIIFLNHKTEDTKELKNYRPISLLSVVCKLLNKVIFNCINDSLDLKQPREQAGFRKEYSTIDKMHVICQSKNPRSIINPFTWLS